MKEISAHGATFTPEFCADITSAELINLTPVKRGLVKPQRKADCEVSWVFNSTGGQRAIYLHYTSLSELPCQLIVNEQVVLSNAAFEATLGGPDWRYQLTTEIAAGENRVTVRTRGANPYFHGVAIADPPARPPVTVDEYRQMLEAERSGGARGQPLIVRPSTMAGVVDVARGVVANEHRLGQLKEVLTGMVDAVARDADDGQVRMAWGGPMNGQRYRQQVFHRLMRLEIDVVAETGTYIGASTAHFARQGVPVFSCEVEKTYFAAALAHLADCKNVTLHLEDSRAFLRGLAGDPSFAFQRPLFYLDAHWYDDLPLADEIAIIRQRWPEFVIMVDDFKVPGASYRYDTYDNGKELTLEFLHREGVDFSDLAILFPSAGAEAETGKRRGTLVLTPLRIYEERLKSERALYRHIPD